MRKENSVIRFKLMLGNATELESIYSVFLTSCQYDDEVEVVTQFVRN